MILSDVYERYYIPPNLQRHMYRVAAVGIMITKAFHHKEKINCDVITQVLTLHDIGKIVHFDFINSQYLLEEEAGNVQYWIGVQNKFIEKFGNEEHKALLTIAREIGVSNMVLKLLDQFGSMSVKYKVESDDWHLRVCTYADFRISPFDVVSIRERFDELTIRYKKTGHTSTEILQLKEDSQQCLKLELELQKLVDISLSTITNDSVTQYVHTLPYYDFQRTF